jgi:hypothetical protein
MHGSCNREQAAVILRHISNQCNYIFQVLDDLEAFERYNFDTDSRKNTAVSILYHMARKGDREKMKTASGEEIAKMAEKYNLANFIMNDIKNILRKILSDIKALNRLKIFLTEDLFYGII